MIEELLPGTVVAVERRRRRSAGARRCTRRRRRWWRGRSRSAAASSPPSAPAPAGRWRSSACRRSRSCRGERGAPRLARRRGRQHHPLRRLPRRAPSPAPTDLASLGIDAEPHAPLPEGVLDAVALPEERGRLARAGRGSARRPLGPAAVQRQGVRLQGVVPPHPQWLDFSEADIDLTAAAAGPGAGPQRDRSGPGCSCPGRWWAAGGSGTSRAAGPSAGAWWPRP